GSIILDRTADPTAWGGKIRIRRLHSILSFAEANPAFQFSCGSQQRDSSPRKLEVRILQRVVSLAGLLTCILQVVPVRASGLKPHLQRLQIRLRYPVFEIGDFLR